MFFVRIRTMVKNRIHALLAQHALPRPELSDLFGVAGRRWLHSLTLPEPDASLLAADLEFLEILDARIAETEALIAHLANDDALVRLLRTLPGIGAFFAVLIRYEVDDMHRFHGPAYFASYVGLVPSTYASGERMVHGHLTKLGNQWLRWAFVEAVQPATRVSPALRRFYERLHARRGTKGGPHGRGAQAGRADLVCLDRAPPLRGAVRCIRGRGGPRLPSLGSGRKARL